MHGGHPLRSRQEPLGNAAIIRYFRQNQNSVQQNRVHYALRHAIVPDVEQGRNCVQVQSNFR